MSEPKIQVPNETNPVDYATWKKYYEQYQQELIEKRKLEKEEQERRQKENEPHRIAEQERIRKQHEEYWESIRRENVVVASKAERSKKLRSIVDEIKNICLENVDHNQQKINSNDTSEYLDVGEDANTYLTQIGMLRIIDYVNFMMRKHDLSSGEAYDIFDSIIVAAKICCEKGFSKYSEKDKLHELFYWVKVGI